MYRFDDELPLGRCVVSRETTDKVIACTFLLHIEGKCFTGQEINLRTSLIRILAKLLRIMIQ